MFGFLRNRRVAFPRGRWPCAPTRSARVPVPPQPPQRSVWVCGSHQGDAGGVTMWPTSLGPPCLRLWTGAAAPTSPRAGEALALQGVSVVRPACAFFPQDWGSGGRRVEGHRERAAPRFSGWGEREPRLCWGSSAGPHRGPCPRGGKSSLVGRMKPQETG